MKNKKKKIIFFCFLLLIATGFFASINECKAVEVRLAITEIMYNPESGKGDWVEAYVLDGAGCNIRASNRQVIDFYLCTKKKADGTCDQTWPVYATEGGCIFEKGDYLILTSQPDDFEGDRNFTVLKLASSFNLLSNADAYIAYSYDNKGTWQENIEYDNFFNKKQKGYSLEKIDIEKGSSKDNWQESKILGGTPGEENSTEQESAPPEDDDPPTAMPYKIRLNEIFPYPETGGKEFVEIINDGDNSGNIAGCRVEDAANHKTDLPDKILGPGEIFYLEDNFYLNNDDDSVKLSCPGSVETVSYEKAKKNQTYAFDGSGWRWTKVATPGQANEFGDAEESAGPDIDIKKENNIYANVYAYFSPGDKENKTKKYTWNFGDSHKSYLRETKHKYEKEGTYVASLKIKDGGSESVFDFKVVVENFPRLKVRILSINANPAGKDSVGETITIGNSTRHSINLKGWSIATGSGKKLTNHPINDDFKIKKEKEKVLGRDNCSFSLSNTKAKIQIRYPDGEVAHEIKYDRKDDPISEGEVYQKVKGGWEWRKTRIKTDAKRISTDEERNFSEDKPGEGEKADINLNEINAISREEIDAAVGKVSSPQNQPRIVLASFDYPVPLPQNQSRSLVLGVSSMKNIPSEKPSDKSLMYSKIIRVINSFLSRVVWEIF